MLYGSALISTLFCLLRSFLYVMNPFLFSRYNQGPRFGDLIRYEALNLLQSWAGSLTKGIPVCRAARIGSPAHPGELKSTATGPVPGTGPVAVHRAAQRPYPDSRIRIDSRGAVRGRSSFYHHFTPFSEERKRPETLSCQGFRPFPRTLPGGGEGWLK